MHMNQTALAHLASAMTFHAQWRIAVDANSPERAARYARWRDESLALAGLPSMAEMDAALFTVYGMQPGQQAA